MWTRPITAVGQKRHGVNYTSPEFGPSLPPSTLPSGRVYLFGPAAEPSRWRRRHVAASVAINYRAVHCARAHATAACSNFLSDADRVAPMKTGCYARIVGKVDRSLRGSCGGSFPPDCVAKLFPADTLDERSHSDTEGTFLAHELN